MRVISGRFKGRRLKTPAWEGLRPTSDKLRETLFNVLARRIEGARVFDGFAGTGAIGIEALSRGAAHVMFVEKNPRAIALIDENLTVCGVEEGYTIRCAEVVAALGALPATDAFDLILLDPPYDIADVNTVLDTAAHRLRADGLIVLERATRRDPGEAAGLRRVRDLKSGDSTLTLYMCREPGSGIGNANNGSRIPDP